MYGSVASGDYHPAFSNVNLFCVLRDSSYGRLRFLAPLVKWWGRQKQPPPLIMTGQELEKATAVFAIEFVDLVQHHQVLWGNDVIEELQIPMRLHRVQVEYELPEKLILLRQNLLLAGDDERRMRELLVRSVASFATLFRHALMALGESPPVRKRDGVVRLAVRIGFDPSTIEQVLDTRAQKGDLKDLHTRDIVGAYLGAVEKVVAAVDMVVRPEVPSRP